MDFIKRKIYRGVIKRRLAEKNTKSFTALGRRLEKLCNSDGFRLMI
jgi:hypothetical protein